MFLTSWKQVNHAKMSAFVRLPSRRDAEVVKETFKTFAFADGFQLKVGLFYMTDKQYIISFVSHVCSLAGPLDTVQKTLLTTFPG